jgi:hypothetical protein
MQRKLDQETKRERATNLWSCRGTVAGVVVICALAAVLRIAVLSALSRDDITRSCLSNLKECSMALSQYAADHDDRLPPSAWMDCASRYFDDRERRRDVLRCPDCPVKGGYGHAMHTPVLGLNTELPSEPAAVVVLFDSDLTQRNAAGEWYTVPDPARHRAVNGFAFLDGHVKFHPWGSEHLDEERRIMEKDRLGRKPATAKPGSG